MKGRGIWIQDAYGASIAGSIKRFIIGRINNLGIQCESSNLFYSKLLDIFIVRCIRLFTASVATAPEA